MIFIIFAYRPTLNSLKKYLALFSYIFHPVFIPVFATLFYIFAKSIAIGYQEKIFILLQVFIVTLVVPILFFFLLKATGKISSLMVPNISERKLPLVIQSFLIIILVKQSITLDRYNELHFFMLGALMSTLIALILLFFRSKASLHMMGITGLTLFYFGLSMVYQTQNILLFAILIFINGLVASSRLEMKAHTIKEILIGMLLGGGPQLLLMPLWL
jgi:membrane-associated phospholipid phosphatase